jgi:formyl-CoA transferase
MSMPLEGIRVLDMTIFQHGPAATTYLADMGAEVIKVEDTVHGDPGRGVTSLLGALMDGTAASGLNYYFEAHNRNKKGIAVNLKTEGGREAIYRLVKNSDVFVTNYQQATLERLGIDYPTLDRINPRLIYARASGYGPFGPDKDLPGFDTTAQARSGLMSLVSEPGRPPGDAGLGTIDQVGAMVLAYGLMVALWAREKTGLGQEVNTSLLGSAISAQAMWMQSYLLSGQLPTKVSRDKARSPFWNSYQGRDGRWLVLAMARSEEYWPALCRVIGRQNLLDDPRFQSHELRLENGTELVSILDQAFATRPAAEWVRQLQEHGLICDLVRTYDEIARDPQVWANNYLAKLDHGIAGNIEVVGIPVHLSRTPGAVRQGAPLLGQHTEEVLIEVGGYTWEELARLKDEGAII